MTVNINDNVTQVVILDISGLYAQIHNQGYFPEEIISDIKQQYFDTTKWRVVVLD